MTSTRLFLVFLGFVVTCAAEMGNLTSGDEQNMTEYKYDVEELLTSSRVIRSGENSTFPTDLIITTGIPETSSTDSTMNHTSITSNPSTTLQTDDKDDTTPRPGGTAQTKPATTIKSKETTVKPIVEPPSNRTGLIVLIVFIILLGVFVAACCWARRRGRRYSVDTTSRADDVNVPLSPVEPTDLVPHNGLQTFESSEVSKEPDVESEAQEKQEAEADKPSAESASPAPCSSEDKPKEAAAEQRPPAPVEPEKSYDDQGLVSSATPAECVQETNENNSNNAGLTTRELKATSVFWDVPLRSPV